MAKYQYHPDGFPTARFVITLLYLLVFAGVLVAILTDHAKMNPEESNLIFLLAGALATGWERVIGWWYGQANGEQPDGSGNRKQDEQPDAVDQFAEANKRFTATKK